MQKDDVKYLRINIWPSQVYLSLEIMHYFFKKLSKSPKKSCQIFSKKKIFWVIHMQWLQKCNFFFNFPKKVLIFYSNWPKTNLLTRAHQKGPFFSETIFCRVFWDMSPILPEAPRKKFILCSGFDKICKKNTTKSLFFCLKTPQFRLYCFSGIL